MQITKYSEEGKQTEEEEQTKIATSFIKDQTKYIPKLLGFDSESDKLFKADRTMLLMPC